MALVLDIPTQIQLGTFTGLVGVVGAWLDRDDLGDFVPTFVALAEARFRREITRTEREVTIALPGPLPTDFDSVREIFLTDHPGAALTAVPLAELRSRYTTPAARPSVYAIVASQIIVGPPTDNPVTALLTYNRKIPGLSVATQTNWLLADHPDVYLYATLLQAELYGWNDERLPLFKGAVDEAIAEINAAGQRRKYGGGPLVMRTGRSEATRGAYR